MISVIVPVYNVASYLSEAMNSIIGQTYSDLQIIVVDDGSTDESGQICDEYLSDPRVTVIHQENRGLSAARNAGLDIATGEYIAFLDSDDAFHPEFVQSMLDSIKEADITICGYHECWNKLHTGGKNLLSAEKGFYDRRGALRALVEGKINTSVWNKLYRRELWENIRFPEGHNYEDLDTMFRIFQLCNYLYVLQRSLYFHRGRLGSITQSYTRKNSEDRNQAYLHLEEFIEDYIPEIFKDEHLKKIRQFRIGGMMLDYAKGRMNADLRAELREEIIKAGVKNGMEWCDFRFWAGYQLIRFCPWLLRIIYPVYRPFRLLVLKVAGR